MNDDALRTLIAQGLAAMRAGSRVAEQATDEIRNDASHPELRSALETGNRVSQGWARRIDEALQEVRGAGGGGGEEKNPVLEGLYEVSRMIRRDAPDDASRDLGIVANGQLALHYWIAAFGTIRAYAERVGLTRTAEAMRASLDEAKEGDAAHNAVAARIMQG